MIENLRFADCKLVSLTAHVLNKNGEVKLTTAGNLEALGCIGVFYTKADVCVQLTVETVTKVTGSDVFTFLSCKRTVVYKEVHGDCWLGNLLERNGLRVVSCTEGISNVDIRDTGDCNNSSDGSAFNFNFVQPVKFVEFADLYALVFVRVMMVQKHQLLVHGNGSALNLTDTDTAYILIVVDGADKNLCISVRISLRSRNRIKDSLKKRSHILRLIIEVTNCVAGLCGGIQERAVQLFVRCVQIHEKLQNLVDNLLRTCFRTVDLIDADNNMQVQFESFTKYKFSLRHGTLEGVHKKNNAVYHLQHTLYLAAEVRMTWSIDDIDFYILIMNCGVFGENRNAALTLNIVGVHDTFLDFLVLTENTALFQKLVNKCCFTVIDMGDNGHVTNIFTLGLHIIQILSFHI